MSLASLGANLLGGSNLFGASGSISNGLGSLFGINPAM
jgi:hypothetical protein